MNEFHNRLNLWYQENRRSLPWRTAKQPYFIWISEIILQQTRVAQGWDYYLRFIERYPDIETLANADEADVLKMWQGLGYYSRARNLHAAAREILSLHQGRFPDDYGSIRALRGVGDYTAAAIASIAFNLPYAAVDGNVSRVISRIFGIKEGIDTPAGRRLIAQKAQNLLDRENPGEFNQAMMEFGALVCVPGKPECEACIFNRTCYAFQHDEVQLLPVKKSKGKVRERYLTYCVVSHQGSYYLQRRAADDIWAGLFQFPLIETEGALPANELFHHPGFIALFGTQPLELLEERTDKAHLLSHQRLHIRFVRLNSLQEFHHPHFIKVKAAGLHDFPVPKPLERFIDSL